jgi:cyanophycinase
MKPFNSLRNILAIVATATLGFSCEQQDAMTPKNATNLNVVSKESTTTINATTSYYSYLLGDAADVTTSPLGGTVLAGGSTDVDAAMRWMLQRANGGDVIVIRNAAENELPWSTVDAYNPYFFNELGVTINSVETILMNSRTVATNPEVIQKVQNAECVFFTGGDQTTYYKFIEGTGLEDALNYLKNTKKVTIGGTSAGCAIQSNYIFSAENGTIVTREALSNPFDSRLVLRNNFLNSPYLANTIADTHYNNPDRRGRHMAFMARMVVSFGVSAPKGIGVDEKTAVCIDQNGRAFVFGSSYAYFLQQNGASNTPERCTSGSSLEWNRNKKAVKTYRVLGTANGINYFDLSNWTTGNGGTWQYFYVARGKFAAY